MIILLSSINVELFILSSFIILPSLILLMIIIIKSISSKIENIKIESNNFEDNYSNTIAKVKHDKLEFLVITKLVHDNWALIQSAIDLKLTDKKNIIGFIVSILETNPELIFNISELDKVYNKFSKQYRKSNINFFIALSVRLKYLQTTKTWNKY